VEARLLWDINRLHAVVRKYCGCLSMFSFRQVETISNPLILLTNDRAAVRKQPSKIAARRYSP
jgi:hypothetical protein